MKDYFKTSDDSISKTLNRIIPLKHLTKLVIERYDFPFEQIIKLIGFTSNLHTLKLICLFLYETDLKSLEQCENFRYVSNTNKIKTFELCGWCTIEEIPLIVTSFPQLEYLKTGMLRKQIVRIVRFLLSKSNQKTRHLFFLCITKISKICLKELNKLIKSENLIDDYLMKFVDRDLYLWW